MLTRIRNGQRAKKDSVVSPASKLRTRVLDVLQREGYIRGYSEEDLGAHKGLRIELKYFEGQPASPRSSMLPAFQSRAAASIRAARNFRSSATASVSPSFRPLRACFRMPKRAHRMWAAKSWRRCSNEPHW